MPTYKVVFTRTHTTTGYVEADNTQDLANKIWYPHSLDESGNIETKYGPGDPGAWEASDDKYSNTVTSAELVGDTLTAVTPLPDAVKPSGWDS